MAFFHLLHLSDFHLAVRPHVVAWPDRFDARNDPDEEIRLLFSSSHNLNVARVVASRCYLFSEPLDALLITGDLATTGDDHDLDVAWRLVEAPGQSPSAPWLTAEEQPTLAAREKPIFLMPGNHDRFDGVVKRAGGTSFFGYFSPKYWPAADRVKSYPVLERDGERLAIIAADLCLAGNTDASWRVGGFFAWLGQGRAYASVLAALGRKTVETRSRFGPVAIVWAVHFPPHFKGLPGSLVLLEQDRLVEAARAAGVAHLFAGHTHEARPYVVPGSPLLSVYCAGTAMQYVAPHGNTIHPLTIEVVHGQVVQVDWQTLRWDAAVADFRPVHLEVS